MKIDLGTFIILVISAIVLSSCSSKSAFYASYRQNIMKGDSIEWSKVDYDDSHWEKWVQEISPDEVFWVRHNFSFDDDDKNRTGLGLMVIAIGSYELYWDGVYLGHNGQLNEGGKPEIEGAYQSFFGLPDSLVRGQDHVLSLSVCNRTMTPKVIDRFGRSSLNGWLCEA